MLAFRKAEVAQPVYDVDATGTLEVLSTKECVVGEKDASLEGEGGSVDEMCL